MKNALLFALAIFLFLPGGVLFCIGIHRAQKFEDTSWQRTRYAWPLWTGLGLFGIGLILALCSN